MNKKIIIFGASGFIGTHFNNLFNEIGQIDVLRFDIRDSSNVKYLDVRKSISIDGDFAEDDVIINLAAVHTTPGHPDHEYFETNIYGANEVCDFARRVGIKNIIFTSSIAPYGASEDLKSESTLPMPNTPYGISKLVAEHIHKTWAAEDASRKLMILRPGVVFGKGENGNFTRLSKAINKGVFFYPGRKDTIKGCIYVKELVYQSWTLFTKQSESVSLYNFAYYPALTIEEIAGSISKTMDKKKPTILINASLLKFVAKCFQILGLSKLGVHPDRVKKLMTSTNISGESLKLAINGDYKYSFEQALKDWYLDCNKSGLY